jgi:hypothetical protein
VGVVWSVHKKKNPLRVLSGELVLNFRKAARRRRAPARRGRGEADALALVKAVCEKEIARNVGATTEELHHAAIPGLLEAGLLSELSRAHGDLVDILRGLFALDSDMGRCHLSPEAPPPSDVAEDDLARYHVVRLLAAERGLGATLKDVRRRVAARLNGRAERRRATVDRTLREVAVSADGVHWSLPESGGQQLLAFRARRASHGSP